MSTNLYEIVMQKYEKDQNRRKHIENTVLQVNSDKKYFGEILFDELSNPEINIAELKKAYDSKDQSISPLMHQLTEEILELWKFDGFEYSKIFNYQKPYMGEHKLINAAGKIAYGHETELRLPDIVRKLRDDKYIQDSDITPLLEDKYPSEDECIINATYHRFEKRLKYSLEDKVHQSIMRKLQDKKHSDSLGIMRSPKRDNAPVVDFDNLVAQVKENSNYADRPEIALTGYGAVIEVPGQKFVDDHIFNLMMLMGITFDNKISSQDALDTGGEKFINGVAINRSINFSMSLHKDYSILIFNERNFWSIADDRKLSDRQKYAAERDKEYKIYAAKYLLENYCLSNGLNSYIENDVDGKNKELFIRKMQSYHYAKENIDRIHALLNDKAVKKIIDYCNHSHQGFRAEIKSSYKCSCGNEVFDGKFSFSQLGYIQTKDMDKLDYDGIEFPLRQLHIISKHPKDYHPRIRELESIDKLIEFTKNWKVLELPEEASDEFIKLYHQTLEMDIAAKEADDWMEAVHSTPNYTEEEMQKDPMLREIMEDDKRILGAVDNMRKANASQIKDLYEIITKHNTSIPKSYIEWMDETRKHDKESEFLGHKLHMIESMYNTIKVTHFIAPTNTTAKIIGSIESQRKYIQQREEQKIIEIKKQRLLAEENEKNNPKPIEDIPLTPGGELPF